MTLSRVGVRPISILTLLATFVVLSLVPSAPAQFGNSGFGGGQGQPPAAGAADKAKKRQRTPYYGPVEEIPVTLVEIEGNERIPTAKILSMLMTREKRAYDPEAVQQDVRKLMASRLFEDVRIFKREYNGGKAITFRVVEKSVMEYVRYVGNERIKDKALNKELGLKAGDPLDRFVVEESRRRMEQFYRDKGYVEAHVEIIEGTQPGDKGVVLQVHEGVVQRVAHVEFEGNTIASDARLRTQIESTPGIIGTLARADLAGITTFGPKANADTIDQDVDRLTSYYRSLGYFKARIGREVTYNHDRTWARIKFVIDEGPRYRVNDIRVEGNTRFPNQALLALMETRKGEYFNLARLQRDLGELRDHYGSQGYIFADINGEPRFQETPGALDLVFKIDEGQQYRVGKIIVNIDGDNPRTRRTVVLNRLSIRPGDIVDIREIRNSKRRLQASELFLHNPAAGITPDIVIKPPEESDLQYAERPSGPQEPTIRGQQPTTDCYRPVWPTVDLVVQDGRSAHAPVAAKEPSP